MALARLEDEHAIAPIDLRGLADGDSACARLSARAVCEQGELSAVSRLPVLVDLQHAQLALLVGDEDHRAEVAYELRYVERVVAAARERWGIGVYRSHEGIEARTGLAAICCQGIGCRLPERSVALIRCHSRQRRCAQPCGLRERFRLYHPVEHAHIAIGVVEQVALSASGQVAQRAAEPARLGIPGEMPAFRAPLIPAALRAVRLCCLQKRRCERACPHGGVEVIACRPLVGVEPGHGISP